MYIHVCISHLMKHVSNLVSLGARNNQVIELSEILATIVITGTLSSLPFIQTLCCLPCPFAFIRFVSGSVFLSIYRQSLTIIHTSCSVRSLNGKLTRSQEILARAFVPSIMSFLDKIVSLLITIQWNLAWIMFHISYPNYPFLSRSFRLITMTLFHLYVTFL